MRIELPEDTGSTFATPVVDEVSFTARVSAQIVSPAFHRDGFVLVPLSGQEDVEMLEKVIADHPGYECFVLVKPASNKHCFVVKQS